MISVRRRQVLPSERAGGSPTRLLAVAGSHKPTWNYFKSPEPPLLTFHGLGLGSPRSSPLLPPLRGAREEGPGLEGI